ncbi:MAG TPA: hypothetical protein PLZ61_02445 [Candidatus Cryosericum sp.]|nr:hypothetical protein [Candidatus Cryosericum sp.]
MAFTQGVAQLVHITTLDGADPVAPTNAVVTVSLDGGATFEATDNPAVTTAYGVSLELSAAETARNMVLVRVTADNADAQVVAFYFEDAYTAQRAENLDNADAPVSGVPAAVDAALSAAHGSGTWGSGAGYGDYAVTLVVQDGEGAAVPACPVRVLNSGGVLVAYGLTNTTTGAVLVNLGAGDHEVHLGPLPGYALSNPYSITVAGDTTADLTVTAISLPVPTSPDCYLLYAQERKADNGDAAFGAGEVTVKVLRIEFPGRLDSAASSVRTVVGKEYQTDANGVWSFELAKTAFSAGALLVLQRTWEDDEGNPDSEIWQVTLDDAAATVDDQICIADLSIRRGQ